VSKNVAVFVDVANIFYAAKAAGVDIDYVTLLKAATAGRDFVRAYAYTGLDPENENQRQFHAFLARSGYKVVSKDIRKYGDGRIKANLDIELVVDLMRTASNLDIAVVVSGDGDFAPAIRAVQQQGVRVEVISFRGNTSSDLIEVADLFTDIAHIARVDKDSARSGRRVAAEGDLSMTEVPEKETEGAPRRRRAGRARDHERTERVAAEETAELGSLTVLPGERLSRVAANGEAGPVADEQIEPAAASLDDEAGPDGHRRRRRRGGRGRGRGRRPEGELVAGEVAVGAADEDEEFEPVLPPPAPHHSFGSVWDSQLGVPSATPAAALSAAGGSNQAPAEDEEDLEEPEIPEYLLAERRLRSRGTHGRAGRGRGAYQAALDRERYGRSAPGPVGGFAANRVASPPRQERGRGRPNRSERPPLQRPAGGPRASEMSELGRGGSADPWSEVPPDLEEMLRAELARKATAVAPGQTPSAGDGGGAGAPDAEPKPAARRGRPRRTVSEATATAAADAAATTEPAAAAEPAKPKRASRARSTKAASEAAAGDAAPAKPTRRRTTSTAKATEPDSEAAPKPTRRRTTRKATETPSAE
jgi:uncharacterized LabA/DUF88 family protein